MDSYNFLIQLVVKSMNEVGKFLKRDFFEIKYIKDDIKLRNYYDMTINKNLDRFMHSLLKYNPNYGIIHNEKIIVDSNIKCYWDVKIIDDFANYVSDVSLWGTLINLISLKDDKLLMSVYYMPMQDELFYSYLNAGCFLNNKKLNISNVSKKYNTSDTKRFGSDILTIFYVACGRMNTSKIANTKENRNISQLVLNESKGKCLVFEDYIEISSFN